MQLNLDAMRETLLFLEEHLKLNPNFDYETIHIDFITKQIKSEFSSEQIAYSVLKLAEADFITVYKDKSTSARFTNVLTITYQGHEFLENIRNQQRFEKAKNIASEIGGIGLKLFATLVESITTSALKTYLSANGYST